MEIFNRRSGLWRFPRSGRSIVLSNVLVIATICATAGFSIWHNRESALEENQNRMKSMGIVLAEQTSRYVQVIDLSLREVQSHIARLNIASPADFQRRMGSPEIHRYLADGLANAPQADAIVLNDASGMVVNWSRAWPAVAVNSSDRDFYKYLKEHDDPDLFVGAPSRNRGTGKLSVFLARRVNGPDAKFLGLVLAVVDVRYLSEFYRSAGEDLGETIALLRRDGTVVIRYPNPESAIGVKVPLESPWYATLAKGGGSYEGYSALKGIWSLVSVHPLHDYPLVVDILMDQADVFGHWRRETAIILGFALAASLAFSGLFWTLARQFQRQARQNARLELGHQRFDAVLSNVTQGVCFFDDERRLLLWNRRYTEIYDLPPSAIRVGASLNEIVNYRYAAGSTPDMPPPDYLAWREQLAVAKLPASTVETLRNGRVVAIYHQPVPSGGWVATHEDITQRQQAEASIAFMARHDALTKLPNRVLFRERMEQAIVMAGRGTQFAVICLDLDNFKQVNDTLGHPVGDGLLIAAADRLQTCVREIDTVARLGGDEFAIIQLGVLQPDDAEALAGRIIEAFRQPFDVDGHQVLAGASIGVTVAPGDSVSYETLMRDADIALYLAKTEGRGTVRFFEPEMDARIHIRRTLESDLQGAIARNEFELHYQPLVSLTENRVVGFEALLRWHHPVRGLVSPLDFIPVAEETGMIVAIGEWVLRTACFEAENWPTDITVAVNLSPVQFKKGNLVATVQAALAESGLRPNRLELEITESVFLHDTVDTLATLRQLRAMGIGVALDDFGTGYSSLSYLRSFPFNKIKIDQSFVRDMTANKESMSIIRAVTGLGLSLGMKTIAEGVETVEQLDRLRNEGCTEVQGFYFSHPLPAGELPTLIEKFQHNPEGANLMQPSAG
jgi:diguanylate cyclase (GGDEF)-like protein